MNDEDSGIKLTCNSKSVSDRTVNNNEVNPKSKISVNQSTNSIIFQTVGQIGSLKQLKDRSGYQDLYFGQPYNQSILRLKLRFY